MIRILIQAREPSYGFTSFKIYSNCPNVEILIQNEDDPQHINLEFKDGVKAADFISTQHRVW